MIDERQFQEILTQYKKHGWNLRRVLLSPQARENLSAATAALFGEAEIVSSESDAAWFSRITAEGREAWELRCLSGAPFALVEVFETDDDENVREEARYELQTLLAQRASKAGNKKVGG